MISDDLLINGTSILHMPMVFYEFGAYLIRIKDNQEYSPTKVLHCKYTNLKLEC